MSLTVPLFRMYAEQAENIKRDDLRMHLAIATNPHIEGKKQGHLWDMLKLKRKGKPRKGMSDEMKKEAKRVEVMARGISNGLQRR